VQYKEIMPLEANVPSEILSWRLQLEHARGGCGSATADLSVDPATASRCKILHHYF
jgi:hypothetical protein